MTCMVCGSFCDTPECPLCPVCTAHAPKLGALLVQIADEYARALWREPEYALSMAYATAIRLLSQELEAVKRQYRQYMES